MEGWIPRVPLAPRTTFRTGGTADWLADVTDAASIQEVVQSMPQTASPLLVLGGGSNVLIDDLGWQGAVLSMRIDTLEVTEQGSAIFVKAGAGMTWDTLVAHCVINGWWGLENLSAIPGSVGGTPVQNVGAYGVSVSDTIVCVNAYDPHRNVFVTLESSACAFGYRTSIFKGELAHLIITHVTFVLSRVPSPRTTYRDLAAYFSVPHPEISQIREAVCVIRSQKFPDPSIAGCAGSTFKNPIISKDAYERLQRMYPAVPAYPHTETTVKIPAAFIIEQLGWKGRRIGDVGVWPKHALVVVNYGSASSRDIRIFIDDIVRDVHAHTKIFLEPEICIMHARDTSS
jgi:UDP-N-acetylmuramate dehydrogenase